MANILEYKFLNLNNWLKNMTSFPVFNNTYENGVNTLRYQGGGGYERIYIPLSVEKNKEYTFKFNLHSPTGFSVGGYGHDAAFAFVRTSAPTDTGGALDKSNLAVSANWDTAASNTPKEYTINFNSKNYTTLYVAFDFGYILDGVTAEFVFSGIELDDGSNLFIANYGYTGAVDEFVAPTAGKYKIELWGAQGGTYSSYRGGYGGYAVGFVNLFKGEKLYVVVGGKGSATATKNTTAQGGYNGGGMCRNVGLYCCGAGGGATHIATSAGLLSDLIESRDAVLMVAGGGAGCFYYNGFSLQSFGNSGGGYHGGFSYVQSLAGTQEHGFAFGTANVNGAGFDTSTNFAGGGGGYYGGQSRWGEEGAGGGSGYIGNGRISNAHMVGWSVLESSEEKIKTYDTVLFSDVPVSDSAKSGDGYARITLWVSKKYLVRSGSTLYTVTDGALAAISETVVSASVFQTYGMDDVPDGALLATLTDPEVLYWQDSTDELPTLSMTVKGTPPLPQMFTSEPMDLAHESIAGISHAAVDSSEDVRFAISFDDGATWHAFDGSAWFDVSDTAPGMLASTMNAITAEQWAGIVQLTAYRIRFWLPNVTAYVKSVVIHYINP